MSRWNTGTKICLTPVPGGRARLFDLLGAGAGALASEAQGRTLWNIYEL